MFKNLKIFLSKNKKIINFNRGSKKFVLLADRQRFDSCIRQSLISKIFSDKGYIPVLATSNPNSDYLKVYKSFGIKKIFNTNLRYNKLFFVTNLPINLFKTFYVFFKCLITGVEKFQKSFEIEKIQIADQIIDHYIRADKSYKRGFFTFSFFKNIFVAFFKIKLIKNFIKDNKIQYTVVSTDCYLNDSSIIFKISEKEKITNILSVRKAIKVYSNQNDYKYHIYAIKNKDINSKISNNKINSYLKKRFDGKIDHLDVKNAFANKIKNFDKDQFIKYFNLEKKEYKKIILFAPHVFADACHTWGPFPFLHYYSFFVETFEKIKDIKDIFWIIKPHPTRHFWNEDSLIKDYLKNKNFPNIFLCPDKINTIDLLNHVDSVVTGRGTIAVESAILGKRPLTCGASIYSDIDISLKTNTKKDFFNKLHFDSFKFKLSSKDIKKAKKALYLMGEYRWKQNSKIIPNMATNDKNKKLYFGIINKNLKNKSFLKDKYYFDIKTKIIPYIK
tara:strand:- start:1146 stop:2651 length:1506 start_codon:yes stop_codon:yes gene_type:complete